MCIRQYIIKIVYVVNLYVKLDRAMTVDNFWGFYCILFRALNKLFDFLRFFRQVLIFLDPLNYEKKRKKSISNYFSTQYCLFVELFYYIWL